MRSRRTFFVFGIYILFDLAAAGFTASAELCAAERAVYMLRTLRCLAVRADRHTALIDLIHIKPIILANSPISPQYSGESLHFAAYLYIQSAISTQYMQKNSIARAAVSLSAIMP